MRQTLIPILTVLASRALATTYPMTLHKVVDEKGIVKVAFRYLAPKGWKVDAKLFWTDRIMQPTVLAAGADSPDGRFGYSLMPGIDFHFSGTTGGHGSMRPIPGQKLGVEPPNSLSEWLVDAAKKSNFEDLQITARHDRPLTQAELGAGRNYGSASSVEFSFVRNGKPMTGTMAARGDVFVVGNPRAEFQAYEGDWQVLNAYTIYGPKGEEKKAMRFFSLAAPTYTATPEFTLMRGRMILAMNAQIQGNIQQIGEMSKINAKLDREKEDAIMGRYRQGQTAQNKALSGFCDYIGDIDRYRTADGTELQLSSGYKDAWKNEAGDVILSDNIGYDPNQGSGGGWTKLKKAGE